MSCKARLPEKKSCLYFCCSLLLEHGPASRLLILDGLKAAKVLGRFLLVRRKRTLEVPSVNVKAGSDLNINELITELKVIDIKKTGRETHRQYSKT